MKVKDLLSLFCVYLIMVWRWGYEFGRNDQMQILGYASFLNDPDSFPLDNFIQSIHEKVPNERFTFSWLLSFTDGFQEWFCFFGHLLVTCLLLYFLVRIFERFYQRTSFVCLATLIIFVPLYHVNLGGNELYYNTFFVSNVVKVMALGAFLLFLDYKYVRAFLLVGISGLLQPVLAVQLAVGLGVVLCVQKLFDHKQVSWSVLFRSAAAFLFTGGIWVIFLKLFFEDNGSWDDNTFFAVLFEFRAPHHYLPFSFSLKACILLLPLFLTGWFLLWVRSSVLNIYFLVTFVGLITYIILVEAFQIVDITALQWFKSTIFLEAFSVMILMAAIDSFIPKNGSGHLDRAVRMMICFVAFLAFTSMLFFRSLIPWEVPYDFPWESDRGPEVEVARSAEANTAEDALFIHPIVFTELKVYGKRSSYVEYKIMVHRKKAMEQWFERLQQIYGLSGQEEGFEVIRKADANFRKLDGETLRKLSEESGITHILTFADHKLDLPVLFENEDYVIYKIE